MTPGQVRRSSINTGRSEQWIHCTRHPLLAGAFAETRHRSLTMLSDQKQLLSYQQTLEFSCCDTYSIITARHSQFFQKRSQTLSLVASALLTMSVRNQGQEAKDHIGQRPQRWMALKTNHRRHHPMDSKFSVEHISVSGCHRLHCKVVSWQSSKLQKQSYTHLCTPTTKSTPPNCKLCTID